MRCELTPLDWWMVLRVYLAHSCFCCINSQSSPPPENRGVLSIPLVFLTSLQNLAQRSGNPKKKKTAANLKNSSCVLHQHNDLSWTVKFEHCGIAGRTDREENRRIGWRENSPRFSHLIRRRRPMPPPASLPSPLPLHRPPLLPATATPVLHLAGARLLVTVAALVMTAAAEPERRPSPARRRERCRGSQRDTETDRWGPQKRVDRSQSRPISLCPGNLRRMGHNCGPDMSYNGPLLRRTFPDETV